MSDLHEINPQFPPTEDHHENHLPLLPGEWRQQQQAHNEHSQPPLVPGRPEHHDNPDQQPDSSLENPKRKKPKLQATTDPPSFQHEGQHTGPKTKPRVSFQQPPPHTEQPSPHGATATPQQRHRLFQASHGTTEEPHSRQILPEEHKTNLLTWFGGAFCAIFWLLIILSGLVILTVYLVFRPRTPRFNITSLTLNAAYLDMGYLLNADISVLANFTNPNEKVSVDFSYMYLDLYYENTMIATQYIAPFSAARRESRFANIHMITSQVRLSVKESLLLKKQIENNRVFFEVKGTFRARSNFGSFLRYSYWLHDYCSIMVTAPPTGVLKQSICKVKH